MFNQLLSILPALNHTRHKGQNGKICVIGGSMEYTGAPYYAAISSLKGGGDLAYILCTKSAAIPIKSYSPECIVYPYLLEQGEKQNVEEAIKKIIDTTKYMNSLVIGPGLGREIITAQILENLFSQNRSIKVIDADGLWHIVQKQNNLIHLIQENSKEFILTPNVMEVKRLLEYFGMQYFEQTNENVQLNNARYMDYFEVNTQIGYPQLIAQLSQKLNNTIIVAKGMVDIITDGKIGYGVKVEGALKRCGGQGDILSGLVGLYSHLSKQSQFQDLIHGCVLASVVTRKAGYKATQHDKYSLTTPKIIERIGECLI